MPKPSNSDTFLSEISERPEKLAAFLDKIPLTREGLTALINFCGQRNNWGQITTTTTIGDLATNGLPRRKSGRSYFYSLGDYAAFLGWRSKNRSEARDDPKKQYEAERAREELRRIKRENDREEGVLLDTRQIEAEIAVAAGVINSRLRVLADRLRSGALSGEDAAITLEGIGEEMADGIERALEKNLKKGGRK